jgi:hypothetical protein
MSTEQEQGDARNVVQRAAEGLARREFLKRGAKWSLAASVAGAFLGRTEIAGAHPPGTCLSDSIHCAQVGFGCSCVDAECRRNGSVCSIRWNSCPSGGYCWTEQCSGNSLTCCDWWCAGYACHCCRVN